METIVRQNIYKIRLEKKFTQEYMANELNISQSQYSKKEKGIQKFSLNEIAKIANILNIDMKFLMEENQ
ncbi:helix-turn-helix domain-containing protein [Flavobacterium qiangtangense]|uniref:Helix-turn-helix domain-containing protein n=1 Tax=Flavobacterium qiangtangense TaxID=1442595 RepID=A0ABW1PPB2_9FLAO